MGIAISGYLYLYLRVKYRYEISKLSGYHLFYRSLLVGVIFFMFGILLFVAVYSIPVFNQNSYIIDFFGIVFPDIKQQTFNVYIVIINSLILSFLVAVFRNYFNRLIYNYLENYRFSKLKSHGTGISTGDSNSGNSSFLSMKKTNEMYRMLLYRQNVNTIFLSHILDSLFKSEIIMITLDSRKCYIGIAIDVPVSDKFENIPEVAILPLSSGYRDEKDLCFEIITEYVDVMRVLAMSEDDVTSMSEGEVKELLDRVKKYKITIPFTKIESLSTFDPSQYSSFKDRECSRREHIHKTRNGNLDKKETVINEPKPQSPSLPA